MKRQSHQIDNEGELIQSLKKISAMTHEYFKDQDQEKKRRDDQLDEIWDLEHASQLDLPAAQPAAQPAMQTAPAAADRMPKKTGLFHHGIQIWHPVMVNMYRVNPVINRVPINGRVVTGLTPYGANLNGKHPRWAYRVPRWLTIEQAQQNTPDKWADMRPPNWNPYE